MKDRESALNELVVIVKENERQRNELEAKYKNSGLPSGEWTREEKRISDELVEKWRVIAQKYGNEVALTISIGDVFAAAGIYTSDKKEV